MFRRSAFLFPVFLWTQAFFICLLVLAVVPGRAQTSQDPVYVFHTNLGNISVQLYRSAAPKTVANFLNYVNRGDYNNSFIHRSVTGFIFQGGGYHFTKQGQVTAISSDPRVINEFKLSNLRGTIAMAKLDKDPNSATNQWFFNEADSNAANLDKQNGGFTVFGNVLDANSLAVMDKIAAVPVPNPPLFTSPFDQIPLINYQSGQTFQPDNLVLVNSITPAGVSHDDLLWTNTDGRASVWNLADPNPVATAALYGPFPGWTAQAIAQGSDGNGRLLWTNTDGRAALWNLADASPSATAAIYGPYSGWTATALTVGPDNAAHLLWDNSDGRVSLWNTTDTDPTATAIIAGPYSGWRGVAIGIGSDNHERLLWDNTSGQIAVWNLADANPVVSSLLYGPYSGWTAKRLSVGSDDAAHLLWDNTNGQASLWNLSDANPAATCVLVGPYGGWSGQDLSVGADNKGRLLWDNVSGQNSLWYLSDANPAATCVLAGPYSGWTAISLAAGQ